MTAVTQAVYQEDAWGRPGTPHDTDVEVVVTGAPLGAAPDPEVATARAEARPRPTETPSPGLSLPETLPAEAACKRPTAVGRLADVVLHTASQVPAVRLA